MSRFGFQQLRVGMSVQVAALDDEQFTSRLVEMGLTPGSTFRVTKVAPLGDPVEIDLRGYRLCLRRSDARGLSLTAATEPEA